MNKLIAKPQILKQANLSLIRKILKEKVNVTRAEISVHTQISSTTVRTLLTEMLADKEIESIGYDESSGGRKAERYAFNPNRYYCVAFCITDNQTHALLVNLRGEIVKEKHLEIEGEYDDAIFNFIDNAMHEVEVKSIGIGVPGIVEKLCYMRKDKFSGEFIKDNIGERIANKYGIPVVMENDLKATAIGFSQKYQHDMTNQNANMAYINFELGCVSAGFIADGKIIRGANNFAGELGLFAQSDGKTMNQCILEANDNQQYINIVSKIISWICAILNPEYVVISGNELRKDCIDNICDETQKLLPQQMNAVVIYSPDSWSDYHKGMASLTAAKIFDDIKLIAL